MIILKNFLLKINLTYEQFKKIIIELLKIFIHSFKKCLFNYFTLKI